MTQENGTMQRIALLSNVNMNFVIRSLKGEAEVYDAEGYGNELGILMNPHSSYYEFAPQSTFMVMDLLELLEHDLDCQNADARIQHWFATLDSCIREQGIYYISDAYLWGVELDAVYDPGRKSALEQLWQERLEQFCATHKNAHILPYKAMIENLGAENAFSLKMWYMGGILLSNEAQNRLGQLILRKVQLQTRVAKKVLLLDLDNTLWGGLAGEHDITPVILSDDHGGLAYKNLQRVIYHMNRQGVLLGIVSKNNEADAMELIRKHPHMVLREECFVAKKINWKPKHENIQEIAKELNLGLDSFVFFDDNPTERELVKEMLPEVVVPDFPAKKEELAPAMVQIYKDYFEKSAVTDEDLAKTKQYADNSKRLELQNQTASFEDYLKQLQMKMEAVNPADNVERLVQLVNKTNQFNLTTKRYTMEEMQEILADGAKRVFLFRSSDRFGDNGIVSAAIVDASTDKPVIEELVMSCRVMGKNLEYAIVEKIEDSLQKEGFEKVQGMYLPTPKNAPVAKLYDQLGYTVTAQGADESKTYEIELAKRPKREYFVEQE